ncbi:MAG: hypothetical protein NXI30_13040 [bacterium]|nr:hypothetical protein [bacterium]
MSRATGSWLVGLALAGAVVGAANAQTTIVVDGANDFEAGQCAPGGDVSTWCFTSDASNLYVGLEHPDVATGGNQHIVTLYLDTDPQADPLSGAGTASGVLYNTQQPGLPFNADVHLQWRADDSFEGVVAWDGSAWSPSANSVVIQESNTNAFVEIAIPRADIGSPDAVNLVGSIVFEGSLTESTFAFVPATNPAGYDPDAVDFLSLALFAAAPVPSVGASGALGLATALCGFGLRSLRRRRRMG